MDDDKYGYGEHPERHTSHRGRSNVERLDDGTGRRSKDRRTGGFGVGPGMHGRRDPEHQGQRSQHSSFEDDMQHLHGVVSEATHFYKDFLQKFYRDTQFIKPYAGQDVLDHLWEKKVISTNRRCATKDRDHNDRKNSGTMAIDGPGKTFQNMEQGLYFQISATRKSAAKARQTRDGENADHVHTKLGKSGKSLNEELRLAPFRAKDTQNLVTELEMILTFLLGNGAGRGSRGEAGGRGSRGDIGYDQAPEVEQHYDEQRDPGDLEGEQEEY